MFKNCIKIYNEEEKIKQKKCLHIETDQNDKEFTSLPCIENVL